MWFSQLADPASQSPNTLLAPWRGRFGAPDLACIDAALFMPALELAIAEHQLELERITGNEAGPNFENTVAALERSGETLSRVRRLFWMLASAHGDDAIRSMESDVSALLTRHGTALGHDKALFARVAEVWRGRDSLTPEQRRLVDESYKGFVAGGAALETPQKERFAEIDQRLSELSVRFGQNVLAASNAWEMVLDEEDLSGLPGDLVGAAAERAKGRDLCGQYIFTLERSDVEGFLTFSERRDLRERIWRAFTSRCDGGKHDNGLIIAEIVALREERAALLGYPSYADYKLEDSMAKTPGAAEALMMRVWAPAVAQALREAEQLQRLIDQECGGFELAAWDWRFFAERLRRERYDYDAAALRSQLTLENVRKSAFASAERLFRLHFEEAKDVSVYHSDVGAWAVTNRDGSPVGLIYTDYLARPEKHGGAWMGSLRVQEKMDGPVIPIVYTVANFTRAPESCPSYLSLDEARTLFHEFGHALHALLSDVTYPSLAGTAVARDFVEFPSKLMEHWVASTEALQAMGVPEDLAKAVSRAETFGQGLATVEFLASALVDLALHRKGLGNASAAEFEAETLAALGMPAEMTMRHRLSHFTHVFDGGYGSAYYSYLWSEVLDADAYEAFSEKADLYDVDLAERLRREVLATGNSRDPLDSFIAFRGRAPDEQALLRTRNLV
jgi:peptidyl-dipeptidase Dcp